MVAARQASKKKPRTYGDYREMLKEKDLDIVLVATPDHWHALPMIAAVEAGADVYVQKPISVDVVEGQAMLAAARKHKRVVQVGTQRRSTPHLIEARDRIVKEGKLGKIGLVEIYCYYHMRATRAIRRTPSRRTTSITRCGPARRRCGRTTRWCIRGAGGRSWNTATASSATCASTCSTWSAGCSTWAGRSAISSTRRHPGRQGQQGEHHRHADGHLRLRRPERRLAAPHLGRRRPTRSIPGARRFYGDKGTLKASVIQLRLHAARQGQADPPRRALYELDKYPGGQDREGPGAARRPGDPRPHAGLPGRPSRTRGKPVADIEEGHISTASCILANLSMKLGRTLTWDAAKQQVVGDDEANKLLRRPYRKPWVHPEA